MTVVADGDRHAGPQRGDEVREGAFHNPGRPDPVQLARRIQCR
jgi:hypothetical protein